MFYTTISLIKYVFICGGHHDSDRIAVLVMVSKAESIVLYIASCIMYTCQNKDFLPSKISPSTCLVLAAWNTLSAFLL